MIFHVKSDPELQDGPETLPTNFVRLLYQRYLQVTGIQIESHNSRCSLWGIERLFVIFHIIQFFRGEGPLLLAQEVSHSLTQSVHQKV